MSNINKAQKMMIGFLGILLGFILYCPTSLLADVVHSDDVIIDGSLCVGFDCANGEGFGSDTIRLDEQNLRIHFDDTSTTAGFPDNDWRIIINDTSSGGANKFSIEDSTAGTEPFTIEAGAGDNALYVDDVERVGLGTNAPVVELHVVDGDTPTMRLEQDGSSGFTPQTWDVAGNETNLFIRDATNGSTLPFRIRPGAPTSSIDIAADGDVGMGTSSPETDLHVVGKGGNDNREILKLENTGIVQFVLEDSTSGNVWKFANNDGFRINLVNLAGGSEFYISNTGELTVGPSGTSKLFLDSAGNLTIAGEITTAGTICNGGCDMVFDDDFKVESIEEHAKKMWANSYLPAVGPTVENAPINLTEKTGGMLNELEKAHIYIEQIHVRLKEREDQLSQLTKRLETIESQLESGK